MTSENKVSQVLLPILVGGLIAGALDITYACVFSYFRSGRKPITILQSVASGPSAGAPMKAELKLRPSVSVFIS